MNLPTQPSPTLYASLRFREGFVSPARHLSADKQTVITGGYGRTYGLHLGQEITREQADEWLQEDVDKIVQRLNSAIKIPLNQHEFDALLHFVYNIGIGAFYSSTMLKKLNDRDRAGVTEEFDRWIYSDGQQRVGLMERRELEKAWFQGAVPNQEKLQWV